MSTLQMQTSLLLGIPPNTSKNEGLVILEGLTSDGRWIDAPGVLFCCSVQFGKMLPKVMPSETVAAL